MRYQVHPTTADLRGRRQLGRGFGGAAISDGDFTEFLAKTQRDELLLRMRHPQIATVIAMGGVPSAVLQNYISARDELEERIKFTVGLYQKYAPVEAKPDKAPVPLPTFELKGQALQGFGATGLITAQDVRVISVKAPSPELPVPAGFGDPLTIMTWGVVIAGVLIAGGLAMRVVINSFNERDAKLAHEAVENQKQENFARVWDTGTKLLSQCIGVNPTADLVTRCWADVASRFPDIIKTIPEHKPPPYVSGGFLKTVGIIVVVGVIGVVGLKVYRHRQSSKED